MTFTRDLVRHGHTTMNVTFDMTYPISGSSADEPMILLLFLTYFWPPKSYITQTNTVTFTRDLERHGNVTLNVTYPISGSSADTLMIFSLFLNLLLVSKVT